MENEGGYLELTRLSDPLEAELLAAFLADGEVAFRINNRMGARMFGSLLAPADNPVIILVRDDDFERAELLLDEYRSLQEEQRGGDDEGDGERASDPEIAPPDEEGEA